LINLTYFVKNPWVFLCVDITVGITVDITVGITVGITALVVDFHPRDTTMV